MLCSMSLFNSTYNKKSNIKIQYTRYIGFQFVIYLGYNHLTQLTHITLDIDKLQTKNI